MPASIPSPTPDYGLDAPGAVRNLFIASAVGLISFLTIKLHLWSGVVDLGPFHFKLGPMSFSLFVIPGVMGAWMALDSKYGKIRERERLLNLLTWTGSERVLDVGCGRGLVLVGAAKRLTAGGTAVGVDLWQQQDLAGNRPDATLENARLEGVADRVEVRTADMREIPFPDGSFDVVLSMNAIHNIYSGAGRDAAIAEIARVLKPGGAVLITDIMHIRQYINALHAHGCSDARRAESDFGSKVLAVITLGMVRSGTLIAHKDAKPGGV